MAKKRNSEKAKDLGVESKNTTREDKYRNSKTSYRHREHRRNKQQNKQNDFKSFLKDNLIKPVFKEIVSEVAEGLIIGSKKIINNLFNRNNDKSEGLRNEQEQNDKSNSPKYEQTDISELQNHEDKSKRQDGVLDSGSQDLNKSTISKDESNTLNLEYAALDLAFTKYEINMSDEKAQKELLDAFFLRLNNEMIFRRLTCTKGVDSDINATNDQEMLNRLTSPTLLNSINNILINNPSMLESWQSSVLSNILQHEIVYDGIFMSINPEDLRHHLLSL